MTALAILTIVAVRSLFVWLAIFHPIVAAVWFVGAGALASLFMTRRLGFEVRRP